MIGEHAALGAGALKLKLCPRVMGSDEVAVGMSQLRINAHQRMIAERYGVPWLRVSFLARVSNVSYERAMQVWLLYGSHADPWDAAYAACKSWRPGAVAALSVEGVRRGACRARRGGGEGWKAKASEGEGGGGTQAMPPPPPAVPQASRASRASQASRVPSKRAAAARKRVGCREASV